MSEHVNLEDKKESTVSNPIEEKVFEDAKKEPQVHEHKLHEEKHHEQKLDVKDEKKEEATKEEQKEHTKAPAHKISAKKAVSKSHASKSHNKKAKKVSKKTESKKSAKTSKAAKHKKKSDKTMVWKILAIIVALAIIIGIIIYAVNKNTTHTATGNIIAKTGLNVTPDNSGIHDLNVVIGAKEAPITIYVYSDFLCPYCQRFAQDTETKIYDKYVTTGYAKIVPKQFVVHGEAAFKLSVAALCAGEKGTDKYQEISAKFMSNDYFQNMDDTKLKTIIENMGLSYDEINTCINSGKYNATVQQDMADGQAIGVSGTPSISINGNLIVGAQPFSIFDGVIDSLITGKKSVNSSLEPTVDTSKDPKSKFYVISDKTCSLCDTTQIISVTKQTLFPNIEVIELDYSDAAAKEILDKTGINFIPAYVFSADIKQSANYDKVKQAMLEQGGYVSINPAATGGEGKLIVPVELDTAAIEGNNSAKVTIVEFSDFECPYCGKFYSESYAQIISEYVDTGKVKFAFRNYPLPFHADAHKAAEAAECAKDQGKFWEMHNTLFENQGALNVSYLKIYAKGLDLDTAKFDACLDNGDKISLVDNDVKYGSSIGVSGTPAFYINGMLVAGALPFADFAKVIDSELAKN
jgi:protein-disulfide isomerase